MKTWSQEAGGLVVWLDELYIAPAFQGHGLGSAFLRAAAGPLPQRRRLPLEVTPCNQGARNLYSRMGYAPLGYEQMILTPQTRLDKPRPPRYNMSDCEEFKALMAGRETQHVEYPF